MIWVDREAQTIAKNSASKRIWVDDMKTPSGRVHVGALRGVIIHDLLYKSLLELDVDVHSSYVINDLDQMDAIPSYLDAKVWQKYSGMPLCNIPSPDPEYENFAQYYAREFITTFESINCHPEVIWASQLYREGRMNSVITMALDRADQVRRIYAEESKSKKPDDWLPIQPICEKCGLMGTTFAYAWDGKVIKYRCNMDTKWAHSCGHEGEMSPFDGRAKLHWKVDWPAYWTVIGITVEWSGKDHMSEGGSYDVSSRIAKEVFEYDAPYARGYEWFTVGGRKMSSSKGIGSSAREVADMLPPELLRFLLVRTPMERHLDFDPTGDTIPNLYDDYDRCVSAYYDKLENVIPEGKPGEVISDFARIAQLSQVRPLPDTRLFTPRFRTIINMIRSKSDILGTFEQQKGAPLTSEEREVLEERTVYAQEFLKNIAGEPTTYELLTANPDGLQLSTHEKEFLTELAQQLSGVTSTEREDIQNVIFSSMKARDLKPRQVFSSFYRVLIGREAGPKAADLILEFGVENVIKRLKDSVKTTTPVKSSKSSTTSIPEDIFTISEELAKAQPTISVGIAIIRGVNIARTSSELQKEIDEFLKTLNNLDNDTISSYDEVVSYRRLYKQMGIDWHSRRPSPEALLRRVALGKGLYNINTCVDAYNMVVMKNRVSVGAFDLDTITFPTVLRYAAAGEQILLLGDSEPTSYKEREIAYFDAVGGYNIDFNYRDSQRTAVSEKTTNILINVDGVHDITPEQVESTLAETIAIIQKYCGGTVELQGIVRI